MAIFERVPQTKSVLDDTEKLFCTIQNAQNINKHTEYILRVQRGLNKKNKWNVSRRYRDFASLHASLQIANFDLPLPPKKLIGNMQPSFIAERQIALQKYVDEVLKNEILSLSLQLRSFLDPVNYSLSFSEHALQTVSIALRGDGRYDLKSPLPYIGWRIRKHYFLVSNIDNLTECMLSWQSYGVDRYLSDKDLQTAFKSIQSLSHPHIDQILAIHNLETGAYVVRRIHENGTILDLLYGTEYNKKYLSKYGNPKIRKPFTNGQIAYYGHQILQAMKFLHSKGFGHGHIHPGNIAIVNQKAVLLDIENIFLGVSSLHRPHLLELKHCSTIEAVDVYSFGRTLYEMAFAEPLNACYYDVYSNGVCEELDSVLRLCLSRGASKRGARLDELLYHPFFTRATIASPQYSESRAHLKFLLPLKADIKNAMDAIEMRLKSDQKMVRSAKREERIQQILNSEEELKKQKRRVKKRDSVWKSTSSLAETVRSRSASSASAPTPPLTSSETGSSGGGAPGARAGGRGPGGEGRGALLDAICSFDKTRLARAPALPGRA